MTDLLDANLDLLRRLLGAMIPAEGSALGADDPTIFARVIEAVRPRAAALQQLLTSAAPGETGEQTLARLQSDPAAKGVLSSALAFCYYTDDRVMRAIGMEARPPFPKGYEVAQGDWSLIEPVRNRGQIWRSAN